VFSCTLVGVLD